MSKTQHSSHCQLFSSTRMNTLPWRKPAVDL
jgi:hypothetical protein